MRLGRDLLAIVVDENQIESSDAAVPGINHQAVSQWITANVGPEGSFNFAFIAGGHSNLTYKVTAPGTEPLVLRRPPLGSVIATAHDMAREFKIISGIQQTKVPVPRALALCEDSEINDAPFYIMDYVEGVVLHSDEDASALNLSSATKVAISESVIDVLADLHTAKPDQIGLGDLGRTEAYLDRQLKRWKSQWDKTKTRELPEMERAFDLLVEAKPEQLYTGVVHGDYRLGNMLIDPSNGTISAVLDWELCTLGDVLADVGYLLNSWVQPGEDFEPGPVAYATSIGGFATREAMVAHYCDRTGFQIADINYYRAFQYWRLGAIIEGVLARYIKGVMVDDTVDTDEYKLRVESLAAQALDLL